MLSRCYSDKTQKRQPTYIEGSVCEEWLTFSNFRSWMEAQDWDGFQLDKDIISPGNKIYSPEFCVFIPQSLNKLLNSHASRRGKWPRGVHFNKAEGIFRSVCNVNGKSKYLGGFSTPEAASREYKKFKSNHIKETAKEFKSSTRIYKGLMSHALILYSD